MSMEESVYLLLILNFKKMKKIKKIVISTFALIGLVTIISSYSSETYQENEVGTYQIAGAGAYGGVLYRLNTKTGDIIEIKQSNIDKINLNPKRKK